MSTAANAAVPQDSVSVEQPKEGYSHYMNQPFTTLALAGMMGFVLGALWKS